MRSTHTIQKMIQSTFVALSSLLILASAFTSVSAQDHSSMDKSSLAIETKIMRRLSPFATTVDLTAEKTFYNNDSKTYMVKFKSTNPVYAGLTVRFEVMWVVTDPAALESEEVELIIIRDYYKNSEHLEDLTSIWTVKLKRNALHLLKYKQTKLDRELGLHLQLMIN